MCVRTLGSKCVVAGGVVALTGTRHCQLATMLQLTPPGMAAARLLLLLLLSTLLQVLLRMLLLLQVPLLLPDSSYVQLCNPHFGGANQAWCMLWAVGLGWPAYHTAHVG